MVLTAAQKADYHQVAKEYLACKESLSKASQGSVLEKKLKELQIPRTPNGGRGYICNSCGIKSVYFEVHESEETHQLVVDTAGCELCEAQEYSEKSQFTKFKEIEEWE